MAQTQAGARARAAPRTQDGATSSRTSASQFKSNNGASSSRISKMMSGNSGEIVKIPKTMTTWMRPSMQTRTAKRKMMDRSYLRTGTDKWTQASSRRSTR